ncbi:hypothetical protein [Streptomyces sp. NPDC055105]|uniref:hypothetical protein n=1 Tax=Streptomyces sp. NPDC055105 TaxID=3365719 RepID=UPI0037D20090
MRRYAATVSREQYDGRAKVVVLRDPVPREVSTEYAELTEKIPGRICRRGPAGKTYGNREICAYLLKRGIQRCSR